MSLDTTAWMLARGAGLATVLLLTASVAAGLALSGRMSTPRWPASLTRELHERLTVLALATLGLHVLMIVVDTQSGVGPFEALIPFAPDYRPVATTLGIVALYAVATVYVSTRLRKRIGRERWRRLHGLAFVAYVTAIAHGLLAGSDTGEPWARWTYVTSILVVGGLAVARIMRTAPRAPAKPPTSRPPAPEPAHGLPPLRGR